MVVLVVDVDVVDVVVGVKVQEDIETATPAKSPVGVPLNRKIEKPEGCDMFKHIPPFIAVPLTPPPINVTSQL